MISASATAPAVAFAGPVENLPGGDLDWLRELREAAEAHYATHGLPTRRDEEWKYSDPSAIGKLEFATAASDEGSGDLDLGLADAYRIVLVDGHRVSPLPSDLPAGVVVTGLADALREFPDRVREHLGSLVGSDIDGFSALNLARFTNGAFVDVPDGVHLERPVLVLSRGTPGAGCRVAHLRHLVIVGDRSRATVVTVHEGVRDGSMFTNAVTEMFAGADVDLEHVQVELGGSESWLVDHQTQRADRSARVRTRHVSLGRGWVRGDLRTVLDGEGATCAMTGITLATDRRHVDFHTTIDHAKPHGRSDELFKTVADEGATGVFRGRIIVRQDAQKTDARQTNRNLLLSEGAKVWTRPQLEIDADDVKCAHGATVGRLDEEALFYLRTRGIDEEAARRILLSAFTAEVLDEIPLAGLRENLRTRLEDRLPVDGGF